MAECSVTCYTCTSTKGPKVWRYLCGDCAEDMLMRHRTETGHTDLNLVVTQEPVFRKIERAGHVFPPILRGW